EDLMRRSEEVENTPEYRDAVEVLKKTEQDVIPRVEDPADKRELEDLCHLVREAMASGDKKKMEEASSVLNDRLLKFAYLLCHQPRDLPCPNRPSATNPCESWCAAVRPVWRTSTCSLIM